MGWLLSYNLHSINQNLKRSRQLLYICMPGKESTSFSNIKKVVDK